MVRGHRVGCLYRSVGRVRWPRCPGAPNLQSALNNNCCNLGAPPLACASVRSPTELADEFRARGLKVTPQRVSVFRALESNEQHPSAESVFATVREEMPTISLRTVYQTLNDLAAMGEIGQLDLGTGAARFDPNTEPHHHLVCDRCGLVRDVPVGEGEPDPGRRELAGFEVTHTEIVFRGLCAACSRSGGG